MAVSISENIMPYHKLFLIVLMFVTIIGCNNNNSGEDSVANISNESKSNTAECTTNCHAVGSAQDPLALNGSHNQHVKIKGYSCEKCHLEYETKDTHGNGVIDPNNSGIIKFDNNNPKGEWNSSDESCSSLYCHGGANHQAWYTSTSLSCLSCHIADGIIDPLTTNGTGESGKHSVHFTEQNIACTVCHFEYKTKASHVNLKFGYSGINQSNPAFEFGDLEVPEENGNFVFFGGEFASLAVNAKFEKTTKDCDNISCHGGTGNVNWYATKGGCISCHASGSRIDPIAPIDPLPGLDPGVHARHVIDIGYECEECHNEYSKSLDHMDGNIDTAIVAVGKVAFGTRNPEGAYNPVNKDCSNLTCHGYAFDTSTRGSNITPNWDSQATGDCGTCHKIGADINQGSHERHVGTNQFDCDKCHYDNSDDHHAEWAPDGDGSITIVFDNMNPTGSFSNGSCMETECHSNTGDASTSNTTPNWGVSGAYTCGWCHATFDKTTGSHATHFDSVGKGPGIVECTTCHTSPIYPNHLNGEVNFKDGRLLDDTNACDICHSPGGSYDGVNHATCVHR